MDDASDWDHPDLINNIWQNLGEDADGDGVVLVQNGSSWSFDPDDINNVEQIENTGLGLQNGKILGSYAFAINGIESINNLRNTLIVSRFNFNSFV